LLYLEKKNSAEGGMELLSWLVRRGGLGTGSKDLEQAEWNKVQFR
jgi:hypothetical protein